MTTAAENELLTRTGPGAPMGRFMREYWIPACLSSELPPQGVPLRLMLLGEKLVAFRTGEGRVAVFDHRCPHRCASLFFGRSEKDGLRCVYHGWKFDADGNCVDMPNVPEDQDFKDKVKAHAYRTVERSGFVYVYMGEREIPPPLPGIEALALPEDEVEVRARQRACNWLQAMEGDLDTSHFGFLHAGSVDGADVDPATIDRFQVLERSPRILARETEWGAMYAAARPADPGQTYYRFAHFTVPFWTLFPAGPFSHNIVAQAWVPMDDTHTMVLTAQWKKRVAPLALTKTGAPLAGLERMIEPLPNTTDWFGRWRMPASEDNDYLIDRDQQNNASFTGIEGVDMQDMAVTESMGSVVDRVREHLAPSDRMITLTRRRLLNLLDGYTDKGALPAVFSDPALCAGARSGDFVAPAALDWVAAYDQQLARAPRAPAYPAAAVPMPAAD
jgi:phenylpropionate dioxygenase-like ring-hydroxylating dioxygenase large terminal subunit